MGRTSGAAVRIYQITYLIGFFLGCALYMTVNRLFPPPGLGTDEEFDSEAIIGESAVAVIEGVSARTSDEEVAGVGKGASASVSATAKEEGE